MLGLELRDMIRDTRDASLFLFAARAKGHGMFNRFHQITFTRIGAAELVENLDKFGMVEVGAHARDELDVTLIG